MSRNEGKKRGHGCMLPSMWPKADRSPKRRFMPPIFVFATNIAENLSIGRSSVGRWCGKVFTSTICYFLLLCDVVCLSFLRSSVFSLVFPSLLSVAFFSFFLLIFALFFSNQHHVHTDALFFQSFRCYSREGKEAEGT